MKPKGRFKSVVKNTGRFLEFFFGFLFLYLTISIYGSVITVGELRTDGDVYIYVQSNGIHTDVCLPANSEQMNWLEFIPANSFSENSGFEFISIGWGDKGFFLDTPTWAELKVSTALNAAFLPSETAMHVAYSSEPVESEERIKVFLDKKSYNRLIHYVKKSFKLNKNKVNLIEGKGYTESDNFYEANNFYHLFRTCNIWTNEALKSAKVRTGIYALFPDGILSHLK